MRSHFLPPCTGGRIFVRRGPVGALGATTAIRGPPVSIRHSRHRCRRRTASDRARLPSAVRRPYPKMLASGRVTCCNGIVSPTAEHSSLHEWFRAVPPYCFFGEFLWRVPFFWCGLSNGAILPPWCVHTRHRFAMLHLLVLGRRHGVRRAYSIFFNFASSDVFFPCVYTSPSLTCCSSCLPPCGGACRHTLSLLPGPLETTAVSRHRGRLGGRD